jgi:cytochrome c-type biogenesis protein CcmF
MRPGESVDLAGYRFTFEGAQSLEGPNYSILRGTFTVRRGGEVVTVLRPESRTYPTPPMDTTEAAIYPMLSADLFAVIGQPAGAGAWATRLHHKPLLSWIWAGAAFMVMGGLISLSDRRRRVGAPARARATRALPEPAQA